MFCCVANAKFNQMASDRTHANAHKRQNHNLMRCHRRGDSSRAEIGDSCSNVEPSEPNNQNDNLIAPDEFRRAQHRIYYYLSMSAAFFSVPIQSIENMIDFVLVFWANSYDFFSFLCCEPSGHDEVDGGGASSCVQ